MEHHNNPAEHDPMPPGNQIKVLQEVLNTLQSLQKSHDGLVASVKSVEDRVDAFINIHQPEEQASQPSRSLDKDHEHFLPPNAGTPLNPRSSSRLLSADNLTEGFIREKDFPPETPPNNASSTKIILTTYPHQSGIDPIKLIWGDVNPLRRGPVVVSRAPKTIRRRNGKREMVVVW